MNKEIEPSSPRDKKIQAVTLTTTLEHFKKNEYLRINPSLVFYNIIKPLKMQGKFYFSNTSSIANFTNK
jgi:hypothetical protein